MREIKEKAPRPDAFLRETKINSNGGITENYTSFSPRIQGPHLSGRQAALLARLIERAGQARYRAARSRLGLADTPLLQLTQSEAYSLIKELRKAGRR